MFLALFDALRTQRVPVTPREWLDLLTKLGLLARVQRSPALWEMTEQGFAALAAHDKQSGEKKS